jgi:hypothetical protein
MSMTLTMAVVPQEACRLLRRLCPVTNVFQLETHLAEVQVSYACKLILLFSVALCCVLSGS